MDKVNIQVEIVLTGIRKDGMKYMKCKVLEPPMLKDLKFFVDSGDLIFPVGRICSGSLKIWEADYFSNRHAHIIATLSDGEYTPHFGEKALSLFNGMKESYISKTGIEEDKVKATDYIGID